ncbi:uncharacterized protein LOC131315541 [Rhododendron vialii]|uniref:uncharacterized protein LOC131315541 n=1 Tax=Rhododendron vialii TaxID=182163 RepID=UPI00265D6D0D|nr:uncharacterized protein LOC131315541 [Rhododendron vialii]
MVGLRNIEEMESDEPIVQYSEEEFHWLNSSPLQLNSPPSQHTYSPRLFLNENISEEENPNEDFGLGCSEAAKDIDEVEAVGNIGSERTGDDCVMVDQLNSECLGKKKTKEKNPIGEKRNKKTNRVRIAIPLEDILQTKGMHSKDAAKYLRVSIAKLKSSCREYGIHRWLPRSEHKFIEQSLPNETCAVVGQEGIPQLSSHTVPSNQALTATVDTNSFLKRNFAATVFAYSSTREP